MKIYFIGEDFAYWEKLIPRFEEAYPKFKIQFSHWKESIEGGGSEFSPMREYLKIIDNEHHIVFFEACFGHQKNLDFVKYLRRDEKGKRVSLTILHSHNAEISIAERFNVAGARLNQIKSDEFSGVIFGAMALYDVNKTELPPLLYAEVGEKVTFIQKMKLSYMKINSYSIETNSPLMPGHEVELFKHPLKGILPNSRFEVKALREEDLYYYKRYGIEFSSTLEDFKSYEKKIKEFVGNTRFKITPKQTKLLLLDPFKIWFHELGDGINDLPYTINLQLQLKGIDLVLSRRRPQIILLTIADDENENLNQMKTLMQSIQNQRNFSPYVIISNCVANSEKLRSFFKYDKLLSFSQLLKLDEIEKLALKLEQKLKNDDQFYSKSLEGKIFFDSQSGLNKIEYKRDVKLIGLTESMIYFSCKQIIPDYTVFEMEAPVRVMITTVPHFKKELASIDENYYIGMINFTGEVVNSSLRNQINNYLKNAKKS